MKPDKLSVHELFERERRYVVPLYQRSYVWTREEQLEPLWEDIRRQADGVREGAEKGVEKTHFLGAVVLNVVKIVGRHVARSEIIDGQQRLTTLQILLAALRDYSRTISPKSEAAFDRLTRNPEEDDRSIERFKVWPTNSDREAFTAVMCAGAPEKLGDNINGRLDGPGPMNRMAEAYLFFYRSVRSYVEEVSDPAGMDDRLFRIKQALRTALQFVIIELEESDDPQVIFETLNARIEPANEWCAQINE